MEATRLLKRDHSRVKALFKKFEDLGAGAFVRKQDVFDQVYAELDIHARIEEEIFYPFVRELSAELKEMIAESIEEHGVMKRLLSELKSLKPDDERFDAKMSVLKENTLHHAVQEEEAKLFPLVHQRASAKQLEELGHKMEERKETLQKGWTGVVAEWFRTLWPATES